MLDDELSRLPYKYRRALVLCHLQDRSNQEAAVELGCPVGSMSRHLARARELLRERLAQRGVVLSTGLLVSVLAEKGTAAVPVSLAEGTARAARLFALGQVTAAGVLSGDVVSLAEGVLHMMTMAKWKMAAVVVLALGVVGIGAGGFLHQARAERQKSSPNDAKTTPASPNVAEKDTPPATPNNPPLSPSAIVGVRARQMRAKLAATVNLDKGIDQNTPLRDAMEFLQDRYDVTIIIQPGIWRGDESAKHSLENAKVQLPRIMGVSLGTVLQMLTSQIETAYLVRSEFIEIVPAERAWPECWTTIDRQHVPTARVEFKRRPLDEALREVAELTGINIVLDSRVDEKARQMPVSTHLQEVPLDTAVSLLANMAGLQSLALDNVLYVTTPANAKALQSERPQRKVVAPSKEEKSHPAKAK
jgi:hypothetical protein